MHLYSSPDELLFNLDTCRPSDAKREWRKMIKDKWDNKCAYCGSEENLTLDHVKPRSQGGSHYANNVVCCCQRCNASKSKTDVWEWYHKQDFFCEERKKSIETWIAPVSKKSSTYRYKPRKNVAY